MKNIKVSRRLAVIFLAALFFTACEKDKGYDPVGDEGQTIVKLINGGDPGHTLVGIDFVNSTQSLDIADIRRDVPNSTELNRTMTVIIKDDTTALKQYNEDNSTDLKLMPASWYTINIPSSGLGGTYTIKLLPGEFAKQISIIIPDATLLDPSSTYGFPFTIVSADADGKISEEKTIVYEIGAKNLYDGVYSVESGFVQRYTAGVAEPITVGGLNGSLVGNQDVILTTSGANSVKIPLPGTGSIQWAYGSNSGVAGVDGIEITVDPITNNVTATSAGNTSFANWAGKVNSYNPSTKTFTLSWRWNPTGNAREYEIVLKYKGPR